MSRTVVTTDGDSFDQLALVAYGYTAGATEALFDANPQLSDQPPIFPAGLTVALPAIATPAPTSTFVSLWS